MQWLYQARKRYGLTILNYMVTCNHVHLLVSDDGDRDVIPNSMQLVAGRTGQEYNQRKNRKGAYWEDRRYFVETVKEFLGIRGKPNGYRLVLACVLATQLAACAGAPKRVSTVEAFRNTEILETQFKKGVSSLEEVKCLLGEPTGSGAVFLPGVQQNPQEIWVYQDIELTDMKDMQGVIDLKIRQQILVLFLREGRYDGFMWFSNSEPASGWFKDSLRGKIGR